MLLKKIVQVLAGGTLAGQHENGIVQKLPEGKPLVFQIKIMAVGDKDILETADFFQVPGISQPGIGVVGENQIHLAVLQQVHAANGGLIGDFDVNTRKFFVKPA